ncbi:hypothetical protein FOZ63_016146, partial [Perkinsus olseni]
WHGATPEPWALQLQAHPGDYITAKRHRCPPGWPVCDHTWTTNMAGPIMNQVDEIAQGTFDRFRVICKGRRPLQCCDAATNGAKKRADKLTAFTSQLPPHIFGQLSERAQESVPRSICRCNKSTVTVSDCD